MPTPNRPGSRQPGQDERSGFDKAAHRIAVFVANPFFFLGCVLAVVVWAGSGPFAGFSNRWQLIVNTGTTIVTFLMVALLQNSQRRDQLAVHRKLDAIADALADFMDNADLDLDQDVKELERAVGMERTVGSSEKPKRPQRP